MAHRKRLWLTIGLVTADQLLHTLWGYSEALQVNPTATRWFSFLPGVSSYLLALVGLGVLVTYNPPRSKRGKLGYTLAVSGTLSNMVTYLRYGQVVDYVVFTKWVVNLADFMVTLGLVIILISLVSPKRKTGS